MLKRINTFGAAIFFLSLSDQAMAMEERDGAMPSSNRKVSFLPQNNRQISSSLLLNQEGKASKPKILKVANIKALSKKTHLADENSKTLNAGNYQFSRPPSQNKKDVITASSPGASLSLEDQKKLSGASTSLMEAKKELKKTRGIP